MIITFLRSSSFGTYDMCPQQYFCDYTLGWHSPTNFKATDKGTIVHKIMEIIALLQQCKQNKENLLKNKICGNLKINMVESDDFIDEIIERVYKHYSSKLPHHNWEDKDFRDCKKWTWKALNFNEGQFDPRKRIIVDVEPFFDIEITKPWASYNYNIKDENLKGFLKLKGTIDLITKVKDDVYEIIDWKTGQYRIDWVTGEEKTHAKFREDPQLRIYHYAAHHFYNIEQVMVTVFYINAGGPFTICFNKDDLVKTEDMIKAKFLQIQNDDKPKLHRSWKCKKWYNCGKTTFENSHIKPMQEFRKTKLTYGFPMMKCDQIELEIKRSGIDRVTKQYMAQGHNINKYQNPGEI